MLSVLVIWLLRPQCLWDVMPCSVDKFHLYPADGGIRFFQVFVPVYPTAQHHIPDDPNVNTQCLESLKSHAVGTVYIVSCKAAVIIC